MDLMLRRRMMGVAAPPSACKPLAECTWEEIVEMANNRTIDCWNIGDIKPLTLTTNEVVTMQIVGFDHDDLTAGGKAAVSFIAKDCLNTTYKMNSSSTNANGWDGSQMRTSTMPAVLNTFPEILKGASGIKAVNKKASAGSKSTTIVTSSDRLWIPSLIEVGLTYVNAAAGEGTAYSIFTSDSSRIKTVKETASIWWSRSPYTKSDSIFCYVTAAGAAYYSYANYAYGVAPGFCL